VTNGQWLMSLNVRLSGPLAVRYRATARPRGQAGIWHARNL